MKKITAFCLSIILSFCALYSQSSLFSNNSNVVNKSVNNIKSISK